MDEEVYTNKIKIYVDGIYKGEVIADDKGLYQIHSEWLGTDSARKVTVSVELVPIDESEQI